MASRTCSPWPLGKAVAVNVRLELAPPPAASVLADAETPNGSSQGIVSIVTPTGITRDANVILRLLSNTGVQAKIANSLDFSAVSSQTLLLRNLPPLKDLPVGFSAYAVPWNLAQGADIACAAARGCTRTVYVQLLDAAGYASSTATASIILDNQPPGVLAGATGVSPANAGAATPIVVSLVANEPLGSAPALSVGGQTGLFDLVAGEGNTTFSFVSHGLAGQSWSDGTYAVLANLTDAAGNSAALPVGSFVVDSVGPQLVAADTRVSPSALKIGSSISLEFTATEPLVGAPQVRIGSTLITGCQASATANVNQAAHYTCTHHADVSEGDGYKTITVQMLDAAGNLNTAALATVTYDVTPPGLAFALLNPTQGISQSSVLLSLTFTEPLAGVPAVSVSPALPGTGFVYVPNPSTTHFDFIYTAPSAGSDGSFALSVVGTDQAGNASAVLPLGTLDLDLTVPQIAQATVSPAQINLADVASARSIAVQFSVSEAQHAGAPVVTVGSSPATCVAAGLNYTCTCPAVQQADGDGDKVVQIVAQDIHGNSSSNVSQFVHYDLTAPTGTLSVSPALAAAGATVAITYDASKTLSAAPQLAVSRPDASDASASFGTPEISGTRYIWRTTLQPSDLNGSWTVALQNIADAAHNPGANANTVFTVDQVPPTVTASSVSPSSAKAGTQVQVTFTASKAQGSGFPTLSLGGTGVVLTPTGAPREYTGSYTAAAGQDGLKTVQVELSDLAGNVNLVDLAPVNVDTQVLPGTASVTPATAAAGRTLVVQYVAGEPLGAAPSLSVTPPGGSASSSLFGSASVSGASYTWQYTLQPTDPSGPWQYTLSNLRDAVGNSAAPVLITNTVDQNPPAVSSLTPLSPTRSAVGTQVVAEFVVSKPLSSVPSVRLGGVPMTLSTQNQQDYTFVHTVTAPEGEGLKSVVASLQDAAGNLAVSSLGTVTYDFTPPAVATALVTYQPALQNPLPSAQEATVGTTVSVTVTANESLQGSGTPALSASAGGTTLAFTLTASQGLQSTFQTTVPTGAGDGNYVPAVSWCDVAGNCTASASFASPLLIVNTSVPPTASLDLSQLKHLRLPQGALQNAYVAGEYVVPVGLDPNADPSTAGLPGSALVQPSAEPLAMVRAYSAAGYLGNSTRMGSSWQPLSLLGSDSPVLYLTVVDGAGNESSQVALTQIEWVASTRGLVPGNSVDNPHRFEARPLDWQSLAQSAFTLVADSNGIGTANDGNTFSTASGGFVRRTASAGPLTSGPLVHDSTHGITYLFPDTAAGDYSGAKPTDFTQFWAWKDHAWSTPGLLDPEGDGNPTASTAYAPSLTYDVGRDRVVLLLQTAAQASETWEFNGLSWQNMLPSTQPPPRSDARLVYNPNTRVSMLFGGQRADATYLNDLWTWDGNSWTALSSTGAPSPRANFGMAFHTARNSLLLQGGVGSTAACDGASGTTCSGTYELLGSTWTAVAANAQAPGACFNQGMAYDPSRAKVVLFGGQNGSGAACGSGVWEYGAQGWLALNPADPDGDGNAPTSPYAQGQLAYDVAERATLTVAPGVSANANDGTLWSWDGMSWLQAAPTINSGGAFYYPPTRTLMSLTASGMVGGKYVWDSSLPYPNPYFGSSAPMAWDTQRNLVLIGNEADTACSMYSWTPQGSYACDSGSTGPIARCASSMVYDAHRATAVQFGGGEYCGATTLNDLWEYNASSWQQRCDGVPSADTCASMPLARKYPGMAYDPNLQQVLLFGGNEYPIDPNLWLWDGSHWQAVASVSDYSQDTVYYDPVLGGSFLFSNPGTLQAARWNGSSLVPQPGIDPYNLNLGGAAQPTNAAPYSPATGALGVWDQGYTHAPSHLFQVNLAALNLPAGSRAAYSQLWVNWWAGAQGTQLQGRRAVRLLDGSQSVASPYTFTASNTPALAALDGVDGATPLRVSVQGTLAGATWTQVCISGTGVTAPPVCTAPPYGQMGSAYWVDAPLVLGSAGTPLANLQVTFTESTSTLSNTTVEIIADADLIGTSHNATLYYYDTGGWQPAASNGSASIARMSWSSQVPSDIDRLVMQAQSLYFKVQAGQAGQISSDAAEVRLRYTVQ